VLDRPQDVEGGGEKDRADRGGNPCLLGPQPCDRPGPERIVAAVSGRSGSHPSRSSSEALRWALGHRVRALRQINAVWIRATRETGLAASSAELDGDVAVTVRRHDPSRGDVVI